MSEALRSVEYVPGVGLQPVCAGDTLVRYRLGTHQPCALCDHRHRFDAPDGEGAAIVSDAACPECPCRARGRARGRVYEHGANDVLDYEHIDDYDLPRCAAHHLPGPCGCDRPGDANRAHRVEPGGHMRGGRMDWFVRGGVSRLAGDLGRQLARQRGNVGRVRGCPDRRGDADPNGSTGPGELRSLVGRRPWS